MNILLSAFACEPFRGSEYGHGWNWACELAKAGHRVLVLTSPEGKTRIEEVLLSAPVDNLEVNYVDPPHVPVWLGQFRLLAQCVRWQKRALTVARRIIAERPIDVVHHVTWGSIHIGSPLWRLGKPFVFGPVGGGQVAPRGFRRHLRGGWTVEVARTILVRHFTGLFFSARSTVSHSALVLVANRDTQKWAERLGASSIEFMHDVGIATSMLIDHSKRRREDPFHLRILWVGRLLPRKAVRLALEALAQIDPRVRFTCTIVGDGKQAKYLSDWIEDLRLNQRVVWRGRISWSEVQEAYLRHDIFLFTSLRDTCGSQLIEAMAKGLATVTLDHQGARDAIPISAGIRVPVTTPRETARALARALERLAREPSTVAEMGRNGVRFAAGHTWERKATRGVAIYREI